jgi:hypothetical protein
MRLATSRLVYLEHICLFRWSRPFTFTFSCKSIISKPWNRTWSVDRRFACAATYSTNKLNTLICGARPTVAATTLDNAQPVINTNNTTPPAKEAPQQIMSALFGSLNRFISRLDAAPQEQQQSGVGGAYGFQVLRNANQEVPLEPWFDFIIGINGRTIVSVK